MPYRRRGALPAGTCHASVCAHADTSHEPPRQFYARFLPAGTAVYVSDPTWGNHVPIMELAGLEVRRYRYLDRQRNALNLEGLLADIAEAPSGSVFLLHACAHNPTGVDPTKDEWRTISDAILAKGHHVLMDCAYQGFASGDAEADAYAIRTFLDAGHSLLLAQSFAKNFGLYGERVGTLSVACADAEEAARVLSQLKLIVRPMYSSPPIHGALIVQEVLGDDALRGQYYGECAAMAERIGGMRKALRAELEAAGSTHDWGHVTDQIGMFAFTGMNAAMCDELTEDHSIFLTRECAPALPRPFSPTPAPRLPRACPAPAPRLPPGLVLASTLPTPFAAATATPTGSGRVSIAGLNPGNLATVARAIRICIGRSKAPPPLPDGARHVP